VLNGDNSGRSRSLVVGGWLDAACVETAGGSSLYVGEAVAGEVQTAGGSSSCDGVVDARWKLLDRRRGRSAQETTTLPAA